MGPKIDSSAWLKLVEKVLSKNWPKIKKNVDLKTISGELIQHGLIDLETWMSLKVKSISESDRTEEFFNEVRKFDCAKYNKLLDILKDSGHTYLALDLCIGTGYDIRKEDDQPKDVGASGGGEETETEKMMRSLQEFKEALEKIDDKFDEERRRRDDNDSTIPDLKGKLMEKNEELENAKKELRELSALPSLIKARDKTIKTLKTEKSLLEQNEKTVKAKERSLQHKITLLRKEIIELNVKVKHLEDKKKHESSLPEIPKVDKKTNKETQQSTTVKMGYNANKEKEKVDMLEKENALLKKEVDAEKKKATSEKNKREALQQELARRVKPPKKEIGSTRKPTV